MEAEQLLQSYTDKLVLWGLCSLETHGSYEISQLVKIHYNATYYDTQYETAFLCLITANTGVKVGHFFSNSIVGLMVIMVL